MSRYLILIQLDMAGSELAQRMIQFKSVVTSFSDAKPEQAFLAGNNVAYFYCSDRPARELTNLLRNPQDGMPILRNTDQHLILELGNDFDGTGLSSAWRWLQRH